MNENFEKYIKLIDRKEVYKGTTITVYKDDVLIDNKHYDFDYVKKYSAGSVLPVLDTGEVVLVRQYRLAPDKWTLEIAGGKIDEGESPLETAKRELEEETGYKSDDLELLLVLNSDITLSNATNHIYIARNLTKGEIHFDEGEETKVEIWKIGDLIKEIYAGNIIDAKTVSAILAFVNKYGKN